MIVLRALITSAFTIALSTYMGGAFAASTSLAGPPVETVDTPSPRTQKDLARSMRGEAFANASYRLYAAQAQRENLPSVARLFERIADVEVNEHFKEEAALSGLVSSDAANLRASMAGESHESQKMYPASHSKPKPVATTGRPPSSRTTPKTRPDTPAPSSRR
ncbi:hypothetical protein [Nonomuraea glycinis]|uniref:hypothetical protein n=1 Tax=Nonomuraea glycinis TaxID=2047744 RepID=UPI0033AFC346